MLQYIDLRLEKQLNVITIKFVCNDLPNRLNVFHRNCGIFLSDYLSFIRFNLGIHHLLLLQTNTKISETKNKMTKINYCWCKIFNNQIHNSKK